MKSSTLELKVPSVGESVSTVEIGQWISKEGDPVRKDEPVVVLETDKAAVEIVAPADGRLIKVLAARGQRVAVGETVGLVEQAAFKPAAPGGASAAPPTHAGAAPPAAAPVIMPAAARLMAERQVPIEKVTGTGPGGRVLKEDVQRVLAEKPTAEPPIPAASAPDVIAAPEPGHAPPVTDEAGALEEVVPMSLLRRKIAERLVQAQRSAALLTTFNEVDMSATLTLRKEMQEKFQERHQVKLGLMSFFVKATIEALKQVPALNAEIREANIVYHRRYDLGIAIGSGRGLVVPVLRHADHLSFGEIEKAIADFAARARDNKLKPDDLTGGTFTISNGGVYGSMLSTPLLNPPQSGVLGMHAIQDRPVAIAGQVVVRPIMYVALTYDHRIVDGREAVTFLRRVKELIETPARLLLEV